ncbi:MAG: leucyl aminopeptidase [Planctomycetes bacterium]|nr:leucyl aminopeptidase [Planctomycetota bacterium]
MNTTNPKTSITVSKSPLHQARAEMLVLGIYKDTKKIPNCYTAVDKASHQAVTKLLKTGDFTANPNETTLLYHTGKLPCQRILLVGLGDKKSLKTNTLRQAAGTATRIAGKLNNVKINLALHPIIDTKIDPQTIGQALAEGIIIARYSFNDYLKNDDKSKNTKALNVNILEPKTSLFPKLNAGRKIGFNLANAQNRSRMIANKPGNEINPPTLAKSAQKMARDCGLKCKIFDDKQLAVMKMNAILAVGSGSASKPRLIMLEYQGRKAAKKAIDVVVVGKAITFDSGGISIKPSANMGAMKFDKSGGCNVLGIMTGLADLKLPLNVIGLIPTAENLPSHTSYRPGDIIKTYSGKTVEIDNTDAEGRLILCDALTYATKMKPSVILDMATLTGACVVALGEHQAGLFTNNPGLQKKLEKASETSGEPVWPLPCGEEYLEQMKSKVADLKNTGSRWGGASTAAAFLGAFVNDITWAHFDVAGVADTDKEKPYQSIGGTGFIVRLVLEYLRKYNQKK